MAWKEYRHVADLYVSVYVEYYDCDAADYVELEKKFIDISFKSTWLYELKKWLVHYINDNLLNADTSYRFYYFLRDTSNECRDHGIYDLPVESLRLFNVFKSEICETDRAKGWEEAD